MKKMLVKLMLALAMVVLAAGVASAAQKVIKDADEYNAYISALNVQDPTQKGAAMEAFFARYPASVMKIDALEQAMAAYQQAGNQAKVEQMASAVLQIDPDNVRALAISVYLQRFKATGGDREAAEKVRANGEKGLAAVQSWPKPEEMTDEAFARLRKQMTGIFAGAAGFGALQAKDYAVARNYFLQSLEIDPANLQDVYQLAVADLEMTPLEASGFWYIARAINLAKAQNNSAGAQSIEKYGKAKYKKYHGSEQGWDTVLASAETGVSPRAGFTVKAAPTECEIAVQAVEENDPATLSFSDWEFVLAHRDCSAEAGKAAQKVWQAIQDKQKQGAARLQIPVKVISATRERILAAITDENRQNNMVDLEITMEKPVRVPPVAGSEINVIGVLTGYTPTPFAFTMTRGEVR
ncbi:MAG TPA: hypothetical protein VI298_09870 [Geobacteraceae bacterium]